MIPDPAVEAALTALDHSWIADASREQWGGILKAILEAAAPHMLAEAWDECLTSDTPWINPYRPTP